MPDPQINIFISYSHSDSPFVDRLEADLRNQGFGTWVDSRGLAGGQRWRRELQAALDRSQVLLVVLSPDAVATEYVQLEYGYASDEGKVVIPLYYRACKVPMELRTIQSIDFQENYEQGLAALLTVLYQVRSTATLTASSDADKSEQGTLPRQTEAASSSQGSGAEPDGDRAGKVLLRRNPFTYGNAISDAKRFFGHQLEVEQVFSRLRNVEFESSSLVGERRIGKTSLLNYLAHPDVRRSHGLDADKFLFVYVDLEMVDKDTTPVQLWRWLLQRIARCCNDAEVKQVLDQMRQTQVIDNFALEDVFESLDEKDLHVVFLLDEFENVTENENFSPAFFYGLRSLAIHHNLSLVTSSRRELIELCHSEAIRSSPFFNIFANINVRLFTKDVALELISKSLLGTGIAFTDAEIDFILRSAGYHPYFLQSACSFLFDAHSMNLNPEERISFLRKAFREEASPHLAFYWNNSDDYEKIVLTVLSLLYGQNGETRPSVGRQELQGLYIHSEQTLARLEKRGLVMATGDAFCLFNAAFGEWIWNEITDTSGDEQTYEEWLTANKGASDRLKALTGAAREDLNEILSRISGQYRELMLNWIIEPRILMRVGGAIKGFLRSGWGLPG